MPLIAGRGVDMDDAGEGVEELEVPDVPEPDEPEEGVIDPADAYAEGRG